MARGFWAAMERAARESARQARISEQERQATERHRMAVERHNESMRRRRKAEEARTTREIEKAQKQAHLEDRKDVTAQLNAELKDTLESLSDVLLETLTVDDNISFEVLYPKHTPPKFQAPAPQKVPGSVPPERSSFVSAHLEKPAFVENMLGIGRDRRIKDLAQAEARYWGAMKQHEQALETANQVEIENKRRLEQAKAQHQQTVEEYEAQYQAAREEIDRFHSAYRSSELESIETYCIMVLERSSYSDRFPQTFKVVYVPQSKEVVVEYELPAFDAVPAEKEFKYNQSKDEIQATSAKPKDRAGLYRKVVASVAIRTIHELYEADQGNHIQSVVFNGMVSAVDKGSGQSVHPCIITVQAPKEEFQGFDLTKVDVIACVKRLKAHVSSAPEELLPVKPIVEYNMVDRRFVQESDVLSTVDDRTNLLEMDPFAFEALICNLFSKLGLEAKLTRSSRDGGVDVVAFDPRPVFGGKYVIQAKRYRNTVEVSAVRDLYGSMMNENAAKGILVTTSAYGPDARNFAKDKPIELIDGSSLLYHLDQIGVKAKIIIPQE